MVDLLTSREIAQYFTINLAKIKRWSREFLPPDQKAGLRSGYERRFSLNEAFTLYLGGVLVSNMDFSINDAKQILQDLDQWILQKGLYPETDYTNASWLDLDVQYEINIVKDSTTGKLKYKIIGFWGAYIDKEFTEEHGITRYLLPYFWEPVTGKELPSQDDLDPDNTKTKTLKIYLALRQFLGSVLTMDEMRKWDENRRKVLRSKPNKMLSQKVS